jgi:hypothetical protein
MPRKIIVFFLGDSNLFIILKPIYEFLPPGGEEKSVITQYIDLQMVTKYLEKIW